MNWLRHLFFHNWRLKLVSLVLATVLWAATARESTSEIGVNVPLEYQNVPAKTEVLSDATNTVEVRLRGPSTLVREIGTKEISTTVDMRKMPLGEEKILPLTVQNVRAPFGVEVVAVNPARVSVTLEPTVPADLPVRATVVGTPAEGFKVAGFSVSPGTVKVEGPANRVRLAESVSTTTIDVSGKKATFEQTADLNILDPRIRIPNSQQVRVEVRIRPK
jgi:YbbR domain-containing protein